MNILDKIIETLVINGSLNEHPGLFYGKTGIAVFFFHYARQTGNELFQEYAFDLIEEIQEQLTTNLSTQYDTGIAGIGSGFEYLLQNNFMDADNDFFEEFDARMCRMALYETYPDLSLEGGLTGWGRYFIYRLRGKCFRNRELHNSLKHIANTITQKIERNSVSVNEKPDVFRFFHDLTTLPGYMEKYSKSFQLCREWKCIHNLDFQKIFPYLNGLHRLYICQNYFNLDLTKEIELEWKKWVESDKTTLTDTGLLKGCATNGMLYLTFFQGVDSSWLNIL